MSNAASSAPSSRRTRAVESFKNAAETIGPVEHGMSLFAVTRGQFSMIDAILHVLDCVGPARISVWTWTIADYELQAINALRTDGRLLGATLLIDTGARNKNAPIIRDWIKTWGAGSVRYVINHAKIATVEGGGFRVLLRGSMNLNCNPRFEQLDVTEGGPDFDLVRQIEAEAGTESTPDGMCNGEDAYRGSRLGEAFEPEQLAMFSHLKRWAK